MRVEFSLKIRLILYNKRTPQNKRSPVVEPLVLPPIEVNPKYQKSKIYKILFAGEMKYVGSTIQVLHGRLRKHKSSECVVKTEGNRVGWKQVEIVLIEEFKCDNLEQLLAREQYWIDELKPSLNKKAAWVEPPKDLCRVCQICVYSMGAHIITREHEEKEMREMYDFFPLLEQDIKQWKTEYMETHYGTPAREYRTKWDHGVKHGFTSGEPLFEFDESEYVLIRNYDGVECNRFIGNYYDKQRLGMVDRVFD
jgi:hypothetical protein